MPTTDDIRFDGRVAIVTGAAGNPGLGRAYAHLLAVRGAKVLVNDLGVGPDGSSTSPVSASNVAREINELGGEAIANGHSVATPEGACAIVDAAMKRWGRVDILITNAGINISALFGEITDRDIQATIDVHLMGTIWMCRAAWPYMSQAGYGRIVTISSGVALGTQHLATYGAAKAGIIGLTRALAVEGAADGIIVNSLAPGAGTASALFISEPDDPWLTDIFMKLTPEQVAPTAAFLAHEGCPVTGRHFEAAGGHVDELFFTRTPGHDSAGLTLEGLRDCFPTIVDRANSTPVPDAIDGASDSRFRPKPYRPGHPGPIGRRT